VWHSLYTILAQRLYTVRAVPFTILNRDLCMIQIVLTCTHWNILHRFENYMHGGFTLVDQDKGYIPSRFTHENEAPGVRMDCMMWIMETVYFEIVILSYISTQSRPTRNTLIYLILSNIAICSKFTTALLISHAVRMSNHQLARWDSPLFKNGTLLQKYEYMFHQPTDDASEVNESP
jgi:hypothetical protein